MNKPTVSPGALNHRAEQFMRLFDGTHDAWQICGCCRRSRAGDEIVHLVRPKFGPGPIQNAVWARAVELSLAGDISPWRQVEPMTAASSLAQAGWSDDHALIECRHADHPFKHTIVRGTHAAWGMWLARSTGPASYWRLLASRLQHAGVFKLHDGYVCWMDRSGATPTPRVIECPDEQEFFAMARTKWKEPRRRYEVLGDDHWRVGMQAEFYPPGVVVFACPQAQPHLFPNDKPAFSALDPRAKSARVARQRRRTT